MVRKIVCNNSNCEILPNCIFFSRNQPWLRLCPNCLEPIRRVSEHVGKCCKSWSDTERLRAIDDEHERSRKRSIVSYEMKTLKTEFPESYLDIANVLIRSHIPVYRVEKEKNTLQSFSDGTQVLIR